MPRWSVDIIRHRSERLGTVVAPNEKEALKAAIVICEIEPGAGAVTSFGANGE
jgi:hypothetical protein